MSQRTKRILGLVKAKVIEGNPPKNQEDGVDVEDKENINMNANKKVNILSHWLVGENPKNIMNDITGNADITGNIATEIVGTNYSVPIIIVPSRHEVDHLPLPDDLPMIIEDARQVSEYNDDQCTEQFVNVLHTTSGDSIVDDSDQSDDNKFDTFYSGSSDNSEIATINPNNEIGMCQDVSSREIVDSADERILNEDMNEASRDTDKTCQFSCLVQKEDGVEHTKQKHYKDKKTFCFYCEKDVTHFSRHLGTWHKNEIEVQRMLSYKCKSIERRNAMSALGKRGNYVKNRSSLQLRPVKRVESIALSSTNDFLPCPHCLGFYKRKSLYRHTKRCSSRAELVNVKRQSAQSDGQTALLMLFKHDELLKKELFPRMRADEITLTAKKDTLICNYAYSYMKGRRSKGNLDLVRQNMRRLAKLLGYAKEENNEIHELIDLLRPTFFRLIINGVNKIGKYNNETDIYESPTVAMNLGTLIKKCCDLAYIHLLQKPNTESQRKELKILKTLVESQWANEISAQAGTNLNAKTWNKEELLPLTSDLKKLKNYLETVAQKMFDDLHLDETHQLAYNTLKEVLYTQIILINRRRPAEVSQLKVETYKSINLDSQESEFDNCLTETEKILLNSCSRIIVRGKRGRGVPILLLSPHMREHFDFLLKIRDNFVQNNDYIFHTDGKSFIDGTKIVYKYAQKCGAENPKSISATRLRKHLATVTQLLQFSKHDLEQHSKFMGHTLKTHCDFYRLPDSTYQTAKISKLLLLATEGGLEKYKGMQLDEIDIDLSPIAEECALEDKICSGVNEDVSNESMPPSETQNLTTSEQQKSSKKLVPPRQPWSCEQKEIISDYFTEHVKSKRAPKQAEVIEFMKKYPKMFSNRKWTAIKAVVYNIYTGKLFVPT